MFASRHIPWLVLAALTFARFAVAGVTPLSPDEAYYWLWAQVPAAGYLDHPPMVADWIRLGTFIAGDTPFGVRLLAPLAAAIGSVAIAQAGRDLFGNWRAGVTASSLLNATLLFGVGGVTMTPDTPLLFFWTLALASLARLVATGQAANWLLVGAMAGLAAESKYTAFLLAPGLAAWLLSAPSTRAWLGRWQLWAALLIALAAFSGVVVWNAQHDWVSFAKQGARAGDWQPARAAQYLGELIGGQIGLATPLVFLLCAMGAFAAVRRWREPGYGLLAALIVSPSLVFFEHALGDRVQANWPAILYPQAALAAAGLGGAWMRWQIPALALGFALTLAVWLQAAASPFALPRTLDPTLMRLGGWEALTAEIDAKAVAEGAGFIAADNYGLAAELAFRLPAGRVMIGAERRWSYFGMPSGAAPIAGRSGLLIHSDRRDDPPDPAWWSSVEPVGVALRSRDGVQAERYNLYRVVGRPVPTAPSAILPRPR
jgi:4-amino-4-deoxy-L-arabinose transferase-like glycosyltransferase